MFKFPYIHISVFIRQNMRTLKQKRRNIDLLIVYIIYPNAKNGNIYCEKYTKY